MNQKRTIDYITGLKGFSCVLIMVDHFFCVFKYIDSAPFDLPYFQAFLDSPFGLLLNETFWLFLFFVTSGYLLSLGRIPDLRTLVLKSIKRFLRLGLPIFFACGIIHILILVVGAHNTETIHLFENQWLMKDFSAPLTFLDLLRAPIDVLILGRCVYNSPYWVLREMFFNSLLLYVCLYLQEKTSRIPFLKYLILYALLLVSLRTSNITLAFAMGMAVAQHEPIARRVLGAAKWLALPCLIGFVWLYYAFTIHVHGILIFCAALFTIPYIRPANRACSGKTAQFLGKISFGIYSFHWPVYCSVGSWLLIRLTPVTNVIVAFAVSAVVSLVVSVLLSWLFSRTAEKWSAEWVESIVRYLGRILPSTSRKAVPAGKD